MSKNYPKEILEYFLSLKNIDFSTLITTKLILEVVLEIEDIRIDTNPNIFEKIKSITENYKK